MLMKRIVICVMVVFVGWLPASDAVAEEGAQALFLQGLDALHFGKVDEGVALFTQSAELGYPKAMHILGEIYIEHDPEQARHWFEKLLARTDGWEDFTKALLMTNRQLGYKKDVEKAKKLVEDAAHKGVAEAQILFGTWHQVTLYAKYDYKVAMQWYQRALECDEKDVVAMANMMIGNLYHKGMGVEKDAEKAFEYFKKSAEMGEMAAMQIIAEFHDKGYGKIAVDFVEAMRWREKLADKGDIVSSFLVGIRYMVGAEGMERDPGKGLRYIRYAADRGSAPAQKVILGFYTDKDNSFGQKTDDVKAFYWLKKMAENKLVLEHQDLAIGDKILDGLRGIIEIPVYYQVLHEEAVIFAWADLMSVYGDGRYGVQKDVLEADRWMKKIARIDHAALKSRKYAKLVVFSQFTLGKLYYSFLDKDPSAKAEALKWLLKAADGGHAEAKELLDKLMKQISGGE